VARDPSHALRIVNVNAVDESELVVHDAHRVDPSLAFGLAHLAERPTGPTPVGIFRDIERPTYGEIMGRELEEARDQVTDEDLDALLHAGGTWDVN
jgi:2-oxoglutarate ferredoxin oxidoreductase subunit beta